ncbi:MAG: helix-turn-helix domain-containing protein [Gemmataceae bacterium]
MFDQVNHPLSMAPTSGSETARRVNPSPPEPTACLTVRDVARRYRVSEDKIRRWIASGELKAVNTAAALCGRPRWVIPVEALADFERRRCGGPVPKPQCRRRRRPNEIDYYPE